MTFGQYFRARRIALGLTLREFCETHDFDPGNISKLERDVFAAPQVEEKLKEYAKALGLKPHSQDYIQLMDLAASSNRTFKPKRITNQEVLNKLPILFRTIDNKKLTVEKLERMIEWLQNEG